LLLRSRGHSLRCISRLLSLSRDSVRKIVRVGSDEPPIIVRPSKLDAHRERIVQMGGWPTSAGVVAYGLPVIVEKKGVRPFSRFSRRGLPEPPTPERPRTDGTFPLSSHLPVIEIL